MKKAGVFSNKRYTFSKFGQCHDYDDFPIANPNPFLSVEISIYDASTDQPLDHTPHHRQHFHHNHIPTFFREISFCNAFDDATMISIGVDILTEFSDDFRSDDFVEEAIFLHIALEDWSMDLVCVVILLRIMEDCLMLRLVMT